MSSKKKRIAWFTELGTASSGGQSYSAYFSECILPLLSSTFDISVFSSQVGQINNIAAEHYLTAAIQHEEQPFDIFFYQLEDRPNSQWLRILSTLWPGITYFHDFMFTSFGPEPILNSPWQGMIQAFNSNLDYWPAPLDEQEQLGPQAYREAAFAAVRVFSQPTALRESQRLVKTSVKGSEATPCYYLPFPVHQVVFDLQPKVGRQLLLSISPWVENRSHQILEAITKYDQNLKITWLIDDHEQAAAKSLIAEFNLNNVQFILGRSVKNWTEIVRQGGLCVHTLFSVFGQTGPYLPVSLAAGLPTLVTRFADVEYLPENCVFQVQAGAAEVLELVKVFENVFDQGIYPDNNLLKDFAGEHFLQEQVASELGLIFEHEAAQIKQLNRAWQSFTKKAKDRVSWEAKKLLPDFENTLQIENHLEPVYKEFKW